MAPRIDKHPREKYVLLTVRSFGAASTALAGSFIARPVALALACLAVAACSSTPRPKAEEASIADRAPPPRVLPSMPELLQAGDVAAKEGARERARISYREAARIYPTSSVPWSRLAVSYFEAEEYGYAILAAQEVLQRDPQERAAHGILAVGGLRVSAESLKTLRDQLNDVPSDTKSEARKLTDTLREVLGEAVLVPQDTATAVQPVPEPAPPPKPRPVRRARRSVSPVAPAHGEAPIGAPATAGSSANPLDRFK